MQTYKHTDGNTLHPTRGEVTIARQACHISSTRDIHMAHFEARLHRDWIELNWTELVVRCLSRLLSSTGLRSSHMELIFQ